MDREFKTQTSDWVNVSQFYSSSVSQFLISRLRVVKRVFIYTNLTVIIAKRVYDILFWEYLYSLRALAKTRHEVPEYFIHIFFFKVETWKVGTKFLKQ